MEKTRRRYPATVAVGGGWRRTYATLRYRVRYRYDDRTVL